MEHAGRDADWGLTFLGVGCANSEQLGSSAAVLDRAGSRVLLIDCGPDVPQRFLRACSQLPDALFITHIHFDHIGGLEQLQSRAALSDSGQPPIRIYLPTALIAPLHRRIGGMDFPLAEGRSNFWDAFQIIPVDRGFWHGGMWFDVFESRHHAPGFAFGLRLPGQFLYTGDTRPIPEVLRSYGNSGEWLFHDCALEGNPSHTGWSDIQREYEKDLRDRLVCYHYESATAGRALEERGARVARPGERFRLGVNDSEDLLGAENPEIRLAS